MDKSIKLKEKATYIEVSVMLDNQEIGKAEIKVEDKELCNFQIFEPFQNQGYGTKALRLLIDTYGIKTLCVKAENEIAKHTYEKVGFKITNPCYYNMEIKYKKEN